MRRPGLLALLAACLALGALAAPASATHATEGRAVLQAVGWEPLSSREAAKHVRRSGFEPRPGNEAENHTTPPKKWVRWMRAHSEMPYARWVNGRYKGTTDEIIQWSAYKWGLDEDMLRAVAVVESWWDMDTLGDDGDSFGLFQVRRPYHCCLPYIQDSTPFNADYYGGIIRAYYDGQMAWLNTLERGQDYAAGDIWGAVGVWATGRWYFPERFFWYVGEVERRMQERTWETDPWF